VQRKRNKANRIVIEMSKRRLHGVKRLDKGVAGKAVLAHSAVYDLPSFVFAG
jgi:hypothetical protein